MNSQIPSNYTCMIDEYQRKLMHDVFQAVLLRDDMRAHLTTLEGSFADNALEELEILRDMLKDLPEQEQKSPGVTHGLCL